jgi:dolichyl-phosphate beta-glucosyltransferase
MTSPSAKRQPLSIVMPAYNEEDRLPPTLETLLEWKGRQQLFDIEVIIVDDGSVDRTAEIIRGFIARDASIRLIRNTHVGYMHATTTGFNAATHPVVGSMEADCATHPREFERLFPFLGAHDVVIGSRILRGDLPPIEGKSFFRRILSFTMSRSFYFLFRCDVMDPQSAFKLYKKEVLQKILPLLRLRFDGLRNAEVIVKAYGLGFQIKEVPVPYVHDPASRCVPPRPYKVVLSATLSLFALWAQSFYEYRDGILTRPAIRAAWLMRILSRLPLMGPDRF